MSIEPGMTLAVGGPGGQCGPEERTDAVPPPAGDGLGGLLAGQRLAGTAPSRRLHIHNCLHSMDWICLPIDGVDLVGLILGHVPTLAPGRKT